MESLCSSARRRDSCSQRVRSGASNKCRRHRMTGCCRLSVAAHAFMPSLLPLITMRGVLFLTPLLAYAATAVALAGPNAFAHFGAQGVNFLRLHAATSDTASRPSSAKFAVQNPAGDWALGEANFRNDDPIFQEHWFEQPVDHFTNDSGTFRQRYWINIRHFNATKGGPVFVLDGGETSGKNRLPFLDTGIMDILPKSTGGIGIILEHRYYGVHSGFAFIHIVVPNSDMF
jgi:hypothetical protein